MKKGTVLLGVTALLAITGAVYFLIIKPNQDATDAQFEEFKEASNLAGWDIFTGASPDKLSNALNQWKKNLKRSEAEQMIVFAKNKKETLQLFKLVKKWNPTGK